MRWRTVLVALLVLPLVSSCTSQPSSGSGKPGYCTAEDQNSVTVIIDYGDLGPDPSIECAYNLKEDATGLDALMALGILITEPTRSPHFICRINGYPTIDQVIPLEGKDSYREMCVNTPPASAYWTYWTAADGGDWSYSIRGYSTNPVVFGGSQGYSFAHNQPPADSPPRAEPKHS